MECYYFPNIVINDPKFTYCITLKFQDSDLYGVLNELYGHLMSSLHCEKLFPWAKFNMGPDYFEISIS